MQKRLNKNKAITLIFFSKTIPMGAHDQKAAALPADITSFHTANPTGRFCGLQDYMMPQHRSGV